jgi:hypothetical protein
MSGNRYWPFGTRWAFAASAVLVPAAVALVTWLYRPQGPMGTSLGLAPLLAAVAVGLVPVLLVVLSEVGSVEAAGVKVAFAAVREVVDTAGVITKASRIADNLGAPPGQVTDNDRGSIIAALRSAVGAHSVVVDLREGEEWWETRLLALSSGAVRLGYPKVVVFVAAEPRARQRFLGWATPQDLLRRLLIREPALRAAHDASRRAWLLYQLAESAPDDRRLPWADPSAQVSAADPGVPARAAAPWVTPADGFVPERLLLDHVGPLERSPDAAGITAVRLRDLFGPVLHTAAIDRDDEEGAWVRTVLGSIDDYLAVTRAGDFVDIVPRAVAVNALLLALTSRQS